MSVREDLFEKKDKIFMSNSKIVGEARVKDFVIVKAAYEINGKKLPEGKYKELCKRMYVDDADKDLHHSDVEINKIFEGVKEILKTIREAEAAEKQVRSNDLPEYLYYNDKGTICIEMKKYARFIQKELNIIFYPIADQLYIYNKIQHCYRLESIGNEIDSMILKMMEERDMDSSHLTWNSNEIKKHLRSMENQENYPFNTSKNCIPVKNGILKIDYDTGEVKLLDHSPEFHFDYTMDAVWNEGANCDKARNLISQWVKNENVDGIVQIGAQAIVQKQTCQQMKRATLLVGMPNTGKSKCKKLIMTTFGPQYMSSISLQDISESQFATGGLEKSVINFVDDMDNVALKSSSKFKDLTGDVHHDIERKGEQRYTGIITCGWAFTCNFPPSVVEKIKRDAAFWKRWNVIFFDNVFEDVDVKFEENTYTEEMRSSFLKCIIEMVIKIQKTGKLIVEQSIDTVMSNWLSRCDSVSDFLDGGLFTPVESGGEPVYYIKETFHNVYQKISALSGFEPAHIISSQRAFYTSMQNHGFIPVRKEVKKNEVRVSVECFKSWMRPTGRLNGNGNYMMKIDGKQYEEPNEVGTCLYDYEKIDTSLIVNTSNKTVD